MSATRTRQGDEPPPTRIESEYAGETFGAAFEAAGIGVQVATRTKSQRYEALEPLLNARRVSLPDEPLVEQQLLGLVWRGGKIDHPGGEHDDWADAVAALVVELLAGRGQCTVPGCRDAGCTGPHFFVLGSSTWDTGAPVGMSRDTYDRIMAAPADADEDADAVEAAPAAAPPVPLVEQLSELTRWNRARRERRDVEVW